MKFFVIVIRDSAAGAYSQPNFVSSVGAFVRAFGDRIKSGTKDDPMCQHPEDFEAFNLGDFDDNTAEFNLHKSPVSVCRGADYK